MGDFNIYDYAREALIALIGFGSGWLVAWIRRQVKKPGG